MESVQKLLEEIDNSEKTINKIRNKYEEVDEELFSKLDDLSSGLTSMWNMLYDIINIFEKRTHLKTWLNL